MYELHFNDLSITTVINYDNKATGELSMNPCHHLCSKHIDVKHHFICECRGNLTISINQISTLSMLADFLTKTLERLKHLENANKLFMAQIEGGC